MLPVQLVHQVHVPHRLDESAQDEASHQALHIQTKAEGKKEAHRQASNVVGHKVDQHALGLPPCSLHSQPQKVLRKGTLLTCTENSSES